MGSYKVGGFCLIDFIHQVSTHHCEASKTVLLKLVFILVVYLHTSLTAIIYFIFMHSRGPKTFLKIKLNFYRHTGNLSSEPLMFYKIIFCRIGGVPVVAPKASGVIQQRRLPAVSKGQANQRHSKYKNQVRPCIRPSH